MAMTSSTRVGMPRMETGMTHRERGDLLLEVFTVECQRLVDFGDDRDRTNVEASLFPKGWR